MKRNSQKKARRVGPWVLLAILALLFAVLMELDKNTLSGWLLFAAAVVLFAVLYCKVLRNAKWPLRGLGWAGLLAVFALIFAATGPQPKAVPAVEKAYKPAAGEAASPSPVDTTFGPVQGVYNADASVEVYAGIPYAAPPVGELRWRPPQDPQSWTDVRVCDTFAPMSMQGTNHPVYDSLAQIIGYHDYAISLTDNHTEPVSEDSLYINLWKPAGEVKDLPVLVFIHGGSLKTGQPWYEDYRGEAFAADGVVTVNMGYRLGVFGFLADEELLEEDGTTGNYGLLDQIKALEWVQDNIASFGGDPANVTIVGESAGSVCVDALCVSPLAEGLFRRAILESSTLACIEPPHSYRLYDEAIASGEALKERYGCATVEELRALPAEEIVGEMDTQHHVTIDGYVLPDTPYNLRKQGVHNEEALLHGYNAEESGPFIIFGHASMDNYETYVRGYFKEYADDVLALYPASTDEEADDYWAQIYGAVFFNYPHYCLNRLAAEEGIPAWEYYFSKDNGRLGSWHSGEMVYAFGNIPAKSKLYDDSDRALSDTMHRYWISFAEDGDPNGEGLPVFDQNTDSDTLMKFGEQTQMIQEKYLQLYSILDQMQGWE